MSSCRTILQWTKQDELMPLFPINGNWVGNLCVAACYFWFIRRGTVKCIYDWISNDYDVLVMRFYWVQFALIETAHEIYVNVNVHLVSDFHFHGSFPFLIVILSSRRLIEVTLKNKNDIFSMSQFGISVNVNRIKRILYATIIYTRNRGKLKAEKRQKEEEEEKNKKNRWRRREIAMS